MLSKRTVISNFQKKLEIFLKDEVSIFCTQFESIDFSNFAFCFNSEDRELSFSLNTAFDRNKALLIFAKTNPDVIRSNPKHWRHQDVAFLNLMDEDHFNAYFENRDDFYNLLVGELLRFMNTHVYKSLRKDPNYKVSFVIVEPFQCILLN